MRNNTVQEIQAINADRANAWHGGSFRNWSGFEWSAAMCGEAGEAANVCKKLKRLEDDLRGNEFSERPSLIQYEKGKRCADLVVMLGAELADTFLYQCLLAEYYSIDLANAIVDKFNKKSIEMGFPQRLYP